MQHNFPRKVMQWTKCDQKNNVLTKQNKPNIKIKNGRAVGRKHLIVLGTLYCKHFFKTNNELEIISK